MFARLSAYRSCVSVDSLEKRLVTILKIVSDWPAARLQDLATVLHFGTNKTVSASEPQPLAQINDVLGWLPCLVRGRALEFLLEKFLDRLLRLASAIGIVHLRVCDK